MNAPSVQTEMSWVVNRAVDWGDRSETKRGVRIYFLPSFLPSLLPSSLEAIYRVPIENNQPLKVRDIKTKQTNANNSLPGVHLINDAFWPVGVNILCLGWI